MTANITSVYYKLLKRNMLLEESNRWKSLNSTLPNKFITTGMYSTALSLGFWGTTLPRSQYSAQWLPFLWTPWEVPGWKIIWTHTAMNQLVTSGYRHLNNDLFYSVTQALMTYWCKYLTVSGDIMENWCVPSTNYAPCTHQSQYTDFSKCFTPSLQNCS
jgi:hypothetical protein